MERRKPNENRLEQQRLPNSHLQFLRIQAQKKYHNHPDPYTVDAGFGKEPFKEGVYQFIYMEERDYGPDMTVKETVYACPKCGILQIEDDL